MTISEIIKQAREDLGLTQEDLAEKLEVSRQAVSKWELGASAPSPENLALLEEVLGVSFPVPEEASEEAAAQTVPPPPALKPPFWNWKRVVLLVFGVLIVSALLSIVMFVTLRTDAHTDVPRHAEPYITGIYFFSQDAAPLYPDLGDGWNSLTAGERVLVAVTFEEGTENTVDAVSLFLTPTGTETLQYRKQIAVQAAGEGRDFALFAWDIPQEGLMGHLEAVLECGGGLRVTKMLNVIADPSNLGEEGNTDLDNPNLAYMPESGISYEPEALTIPIGATLFLDEPDEPLLLLRASGAPEEEIVWTSSNPAVVEVSDIGALFPVSPGAAVVTAEWNGQTAECQIEVFTGTVPTDVPGVRKVVQ